MRKNLVDNYTDVIDKLQEVLDVIEQVRDEGNTSDFLDSVEAQACDMKTWIETKKVATENQFTTAENWLDGVNKWLKD